MPPEEASIPADSPDPLSASNSPRIRKRRIVVVDGHEILRCGWRHIFALADDLEICGEASTVADALILVEQTQPDLVVTGLVLPDRSGLEFVKEVTKRHPKIPVLAVSMHVERIYAQRVLKAGGMGYITKEAASDRLVEAIRQVLSGRRYVSPAQTAAYLTGMVKGGHLCSPLDHLTNREMEVLELIGRGLSLEEIANLLSVASRTVEAHRTNIRRKLDLADSDELFIYAVRLYQSGLQPPEEGR